LSDIFKSEQFYLADIGWVGVIFEFGILGALLVAAVYGTGLVVTMRAGAGGDPFMQALSSYVLFMIVTSAIYSVVFTPGELATVVAMSEYLARYAPRVPGPRAASGFVALSPHDMR
jgi:O-antigen ligase